MVIRGYSFWCEKKHEYISFSFILKFISSSILWPICFTFVIVLIALLCFFLRMLLIFLYIFSPMSVTLRHSSPFFYKTL